MSLSSSGVKGVGSLSGGPGAGLYPISVVTELTGIGANTLRGYERAGLLRPARTDGGVRRYSAHDLAVVSRAAELTGDGINLAGVGRILMLEAEVAALRAQIEGLRRHATAKDSRAR